MANIVDFGIRVKGKKENCEIVFSTQKVSEYNDKKYLKNDYLYFSGDCKDGIDAYAEYINEDDLDLSKINIDDIEKIEKMSLKLKSKLLDCEIEVYEASDEDIPNVKHYGYRNGEEVFNENICIFDIKNCKYKYDKYDDIYSDIDFSKCFVMGTKKEKSISNKSANDDGSYSYFEDGIIHFGTANGLRYEDTTLESYVGNESTVEVHKFTFDIAKEAFANCNTIEKIITTDKLKFIGAKAFANCINLKEVYTYSDNVNIDLSAFDGCNLQELVIYGKENSSVEKYCIEKNIKFKKND